MSTASGGGDAKGESAADVAGGVEVTGSGFRGPMWADVARKLLARFDPVVHAEVHNESHMHNVAEDSETHLKVVIVSDVFQGVPLLARHRQVWHARTLSCCAPAHTLYTTTRVGIRRVVCARYPLHGVIFRREMLEPARRGSALPQHPSRREGEGIGAQAAPCPSTHAPTRM